MSIEVTTIGDGRTTLARVDETFSMRVGEGDAPSIGFVISCVDRSLEVVFTGDDSAAQIAALAGVLLGWLVENRPMYSGAAVLTAGQAIKNYRRKWKPDGV